MNPKAKKAATDGSVKEKGSDRRQRILNAARDRFAASGFESTTVRQIADDVGLLAGSLYYHFANKEEMLHESLRDVVYRLRDGARAIHARADDPESKLVALIFFDVEERTANQEAHAILHQERAYFRQNPDLNYISKARREHYLVWRALIEQGIAEGYFSADINVFLTLTTMIRMLNTGADWFLHDDPATIDAAGIISRDELSAFYVKLVLRTVRTPDRITAPIPWPPSYAASQQGKRTNS
jgi:AcrR family transcriptional regulator